MTIEKIRERILEVFASLNSRVIKEAPKIPQPTSTPEGVRGGSGASPSTAQKVWVKNRESGSVYQVKRETLKKDRKKYTIPSKEEEKEKRKSAEERPARKPPARKKTSKKRPTKKKPTPRVTGEYREKSGGIFKPDQFIKKSGASSDYIPDRDKFDHTDPMTQAVVAEFDQNKGLFVHKDQDGNLLKTDNHGGQVHYMQKNAEGLREYLSSRSNFSSETQHKALQKFTDQFEKIVSDFTKTKSDKERLALSIRLEKSFEEMLRTMDEGEWDTGPLKDFSEFVEHNSELLLGQENYMPSAGNFKIGDKVMFYRDKVGGVRCAHGSFKSESSLPKDAILRKGGAAPSVVGEIHAVTFFKNKKKDQQFKKALESLYKNPSISLAKFEEEHRKILIQHFGDKKGAKLYADMAKTRKKVLKENQQNFAGKLEELEEAKEHIRKTEKNADLRDQAIEELDRIKHKLGRHISMYAGIVPLFSQILSANFTTQVSLFTRGTRGERGQLHKAEIIGFEGYSAHSKYAQISVKGKSAEEILANRGAKPRHGGTHQIDSPNCVPIFNEKILSVEEYCEQKQQKINALKENNG